MHFQMLGGLRLPLSLQTLHYLTQPAELPPPPQTAQITNLPLCYVAQTTQSPLLPLLVVHRSPANLRSRVARGLFAWTQGS